MSNKANRVESNYMPGKFASDGLLPGLRWPLPCERLGCWILCVDRLDSPRMDVVCGYYTWFQRSTGYPTNSKNTINDNRHSKALYIFSRFRQPGAIKLTLVARPDWIPAFIITYIFEHSIRKLCQDGIDRYVYLDGIRRRKLLQDGEACMTVRGAPYA